MYLVANMSGCTSMSARESMKDCADCPVMVVVPAGMAILGAAANDPFRRPDEVPERTFTIREPFAVSRHEITRDEYEAFVRDTHGDAFGDCLTDRRLRGKWEYDAETTFRDPGFVQTGAHPVACVSWLEAQAYIAWLNARTGGGYRLLTEVEWEYVARGGTTQSLIYPWGDNAADGCAFANGFDQSAKDTYSGMDTSGYDTFDPMTCRDGWLNTAPVGSLEANQFGVYDMIGNVGEWIEDCYSPSRDAPSDTCAPSSIDTSECSRRIVKGGSWGTLAHNLRTAERVPYPATHRDDSVGIRVAKTLRGVR
jgi:formylglycine-generating enzyme required for sulfatase activity